MEKGTHMGNKLHTTKIISCLCVPNSNALLSPLHGLLQDPIGYPKQGEELLESYLLHMAFRKKKAEE